MFGSVDASIVPIWEANHLFVANGNGKAARMRIDQKKAYIFPFVIRYRSAQQDL
jgi:hypothetical protein